MADERWLGEARENGELVLRIGDAGDSLVAEWIGRARVVVRRDGSEIHVDAAPGADPREVEKLKGGAVQLFLHHLAGKIGLHGAAFEIEGRAAVVVGKSGQGKSTLAAGMCRHAGASLCADDAVALERTAEGWFVKALEAEHWLDSRARQALLGEPSVSESKEPVPAPRVSTRDTRLAFIADLVYADVDAPRIVVYTGLEAMAALLPLVVRFVLDVPSLQRQELDQLHDLVTAVPVIRLVRPRDLACLSASIDLVASALRGGGSR